MFRPSKERIGELFASSRYIIIARAISRRLAERGKIDKVFSKEEVEELLSSVTEGFEKEVSAQCHMHRLGYHEKSKLDQSTVLHQSLQWFETKWSCLDTRAHLVPGKSALSTLNRRLQERHGINLTHTMIVNAMAARDIPQDLREILEAFDQFAGS